MNYRTKLVIDRIIGPPLGILFNLLALAVGAVLRRDHTFKPLYGKRVVICKIVGLGSIVEFAPYLYSLKKKYPDVKITFVTSTSNKELMQMLSPGIDEVLYINDSSFLKLIRSTIQTIVKLMLRKADTFINLEVYSYFTTFISILSLARNRYSYYRKSAAFRNGIDTHHIYFNTKRPIKQVYEQVMRLLGVDTIEPVHQFSFLITDGQKQQVNEFLTKAKVNRFVIINSNASDLMPERKWLIENWVLVIQYLLHETPVKILLSGSGAEREIVEEKFSELLKSNPERVKNVAGIFGLAAYTYLLSKAELMISNDSGPLHLAFSQKIKCISLWGPTDPAHLSLRSDNNQEVYKEVYCSPCLHHADRPPCKGNNICMKLITSTDVIEKIQLLQNS